MIIPKDYTPLQSHHQIGGSGEKALNWEKKEQTITRTFTAAQTVKNLPAMQETRVRSLGREDPWRREWQCIPVLLPGVSHGWRSLPGYSPWSHKELDTTE